MSDSPFRRVVDDLTGGCGCACHTGIGYNAACEHCQPSTRTEPRTPLLERINDVRLAAVANGHTWILGSDAWMRLVGFAHQAEAAAPAGSLDDSEHGMMVGELWLDREHGRAWVHYGDDWQLMDSMPHPARLARGKRDE